MNTREEKLRLRKNLTGAEHSGDGGIYRSLFNGDLKTKTNTNTMRSFFTRKHEKQRQAQAVVKSANYFNAVSSISRGEKLHNVEFDLDSAYMQYIKTRFVKQA
jgi:hypothetical protein